MGRSTRQRDAALSSVREKAVTYIIIPLIDEHLESIFKRLGRLNSSPILVVGFSYASIEHPANQNSFTRGRMTAFPFWAELTSVAFPGLG